MSNVIKFPRSSTTHTNTPESNVAFTTEIEGYTVTFYDDDLWSHGCNVLDAESLSDSAFLGSSMLVDEVSRIQAAVIRDPSLIPMVRRQLVRIAENIEKSIDSD